MNKNQTCLEQFTTASTVETPPSDEQEAPTRDRDRDRENSAEPATDPAPLVEENNTNETERGEEGSDGDPGNDVNTAQSQVEKNSDRNDEDGTDDHGTVTTRDPAPDTEPLDEQPDAGPQPPAEQTTSTEESLGDPVSLINVDFRDTPSNAITLYGKDKGAYLETTVDGHTTTTWFEAEDTKVINQHARFTVSDHIEWTASECTRSRTRVLIVTGDSRGYQIIEPVLHKDEVRVDTDRERRYRRTNIPGVEEKIIESKERPRKRLVKKSIKLTRELIQDHCEVRVFLEKITEQTGPGGCTRTTTGRLTLLSPPRDALLDEFTELAVKLGDTPTKEDVREYAAYSPTVFLSQFDSWDELVREAGV